ncbi:MAG: alpha/beta fold hydrolase [Anaerolineae bacterium]|nr:alpha/beta fold hydrolase [Anaerolineae bacterium]
MKPLDLIFLLIAIFVSIIPVHAQSIPTFDSVDCPMPIPDGATVVCGVYQVPENRSKPTGRMIRMPFAILKSQNPNPQPDPVVFVSSGGPGGSSLDALAAYVNSGYLQERDFIFVEQRGNKYAEPALECPEVQMAMFANFSTVDSREIEIAREVDAARMCRDRLLVQGIDLSAYNSAESAADLEDLRQLLGYEQWNLVGASYSARLVLTTMRLYPEGIRSVVLDSVYVPEVNAYEQRVPTLAQALETLFANCSADVGCGTAYPNLESHFYTVIERMNNEPIAVDVSHPITDEVVTLQLTGDDMVLGIFNALYQRNTIRFLPFIIEELYRGNTDVIEPVAQEGFKNIFSRAQGMYYSAECREEFPFNDSEKQKEFASQYPALANFMPSISEPVICEMWGAGVANVSDNQAVVSDIPSLVLAGDYDPVTSPEFTQATTDNLSNSYFYQLPHFGHAVQDQSNCANQLAVSFIQSPTREPDTACLQNLSRLDFVTVDSDILPTRFAYWVNREILQAENPLLAASIALFILSFVIQLLVFIVNLKSMRSLAEILPSCTAILNVATIFWFYRIVTTIDVTLLGFGLPASAAPLVGLWIAAGLCILVSIAAQVKTRTALSVISTAASVALQVLVWVVR